MERAKGYGSLQQRRKVNTELQKMRLDAKNLQEELEDTEVN